MKSNPSRDHGNEFEKHMCKSLNDLIRKINCAGVCYKMHDEGAGHQPIDLLIDSTDLGYIGVECKSTYDADNLEMRKLNRPGEFGLGQIEKQHAFLRNGGRYGIIAIEIRKYGHVFLLPHQYVFNKVERRETHLTIDEIKEIGLRLHKDLSRDELMAFIKQYCRTGAYYEPIE